MDKIGELWDTFGSPCGHDNCEEPIRTVGFKFVNDSGFEIILALCQLHLDEFMADFIYARKIVGYSEL